MIRYGVWHDGNHYGYADGWHDNLERWDSLKDVHISLLRRRDGCDAFQYLKDVDGFFIPDPDRTGVFDTHEVNEGQFIDLYDIQSGEPYERLSLGPRKGLVRERF